jgi:tRNA modification GTPase
MNDTIAAVATPAGRGALSVIRVSGPDTVARVARAIKPCRRPLAKLKPWRLNLARAHDPATGSLIDEVLLAVFKGPKSYTGEDMIEISCHGNPQVVRSVLEALISTGIRLAEPGEFTRRAFENGRIDLSRAEAIAMMTAAETDAARRAVLRVLDGGLGDPVRAVRNLVTDIRMAFELELDFPDENVSYPAETIEKRLHDAENTLTELIDAGHAGDLADSDHHVVISGKVNAGKSTLFNQLTGRNRAIVSDEAGTTRDALEIPAEWNDYRLTLVDTAGIRQAVSPAEQEAVHRTQTLLRHADLIVYVIDGADPDLELLTRVNLIAGYPRMLIFWNKTDLGTPDKNHITAITAFDNVIGFIQGSAREGKEINSLRDAILSHLSRSSSDASETLLMMSLRQRNALEDALRLTREAHDLYHSNAGLECITPLLRTVDHRLGLILGDTVSPDLLTGIFSSFCIGK